VAGPSEARGDGPLVSIVTPSYNQAAYLDETIRSVLEQDYANIEYVVIDGGSTDCSVDIIRRYADRLAFWVSEPDRGQAEAINKGFACTSGSVMAYLNSDDLYTPGAVRRAVEVLGANQKLGFVYAECDMIDSNGGYVRRYGTRPFDRADLLRGGTYVPQPTVFWRRSAWDRVGPLRTDLRYAMDLDFWMKIGAHYDVLYVPEVWAKYRLHETSKTVAEGPRFAREGPLVVDPLQTRGRLLKLALEHPPAYLTPRMLVFLAARILPSGLMRRINRARGYPPPPR
jgi:glycosyltransferase involved in cell wall biosynthesis